MAIKCRITPEPRIEVDAFVSCPNLGVKGPVIFVIDTGSPVTSLGHRDAIAMNLQVASLSRSHRPVMGIGGFAQTFEIPDVDIILSGGGDQAYCRLGIIYYHRPVKRKKTKTDGVLVYHEDAVSAAPSIMGFDAFRAMQLVLETDFTTDAVLKPRTTTAPLEAGKSSKS